MSESETSLSDENERRRSKKRPRGEKVHFASKNQPEWPRTEKESLHHWLRDHPHAKPEQVPARYKECHTKAAIQAFIRGDENLQGLRALQRKIFIFIFIFFPPSMSFFFLRTRPM